jgi:hypothetical protein
MRIQYRESGKLGPLTPLLDARQARIGRKLIGLSLLLGDRTLSVLHHFAESVALSSFVEIVFFTWHELRRVVKHPEGSG